MQNGLGKAVEPPGGGAPQPLVSPPPRALRGLIGLRLIVITTLFIGVLIVQAATSKILPIRDFYAIFLSTYGLSIFYIILHVRRASTQVQATIQLLGDIGIVTGVVYATGGAYSPFSFLYLSVIVVSVFLLSRRGLLFAGGSAVAYGLLVNLQVYEVIKIPSSSLQGVPDLSTTSILYQLMVHVVGFILVTYLVSRLTENLRSTHLQLEEETERSTRLAALTRHVVRSVGSGIVAADLDGTVLHINPAGERILGMDAEEVVGKGLNQVIPLRNHDLEAIRNQARSGMRIEGQLQSSSVRLGLSLGPLQDEQGAVVGFVINFQDLSQLEGEAVRRRMQERMAAVGELAARMAHEIKNPLASISGSAQMLTGRGIDDTGRRLLDIIIDESGRLSGILDGFLDYTRPRQDTRKPCDLPALLRDCLALLKRSAEIRDDHRLVLKLPDTLVLSGDPQLLRQVFWNLSINAFQAMPSGGELAITLRRSSSSAILQWSDTGIGMEKEILERAFEPFITTQPEGTGLGLAMVYAAVENHGGSISIDSVEGEGTTVTVNLPCEPEQT